MNEQVNAYISKAPEGQRAILERLRQLIHKSTNGVEEAYKWNRPVFRAKKDFAYLKTAKGYVTLGFFDFRKLDDPGHLLEGTGKDMRHIKLKKAEEMDEALLLQWLRSAAG